MFIGDRLYGRQRFFTIDFAIFCVYTNYNSTCKKGHMLQKHFQLI